MNDTLITLVSLTETGCRLGERLASAISAEHLHKPQPFADTVRSRYQAGQRLVFITATGIAVRTLAPVLQNKISDPPVLVLDEHGQFVIPLLSGHEGGANEWARHVAGLLGAQCVITSAQRYTHPLYVAGIGCDRGCPVEEIAALVDDTLHNHPASPGIEAISLAASIDIKIDEVGLCDWAARCAEPARFYSADHLLNYTERLSETSQYVFDAVGCYGVAEAAALAGAEALSGGAAELIIHKHKSARATFALARAYRPSEPD